MTTQTIPTLEQYKAQLQARPAYVAGSDKKTVKMVAKLIADINAKMDAGQFEEAERLIDGVQDVRNIPFKIEFAAQCEGMF